MDSSAMEIDQESPSCTPTWQELTLTYLKIGTIGFGGGYAVIDLIHSELVEKHRWLTEQRFQNMIALSEVAPGALTVNLLAGIAYRLGGVKTMVIATAALILPSFLLVVALAKIFLTWQSNPLVQGAMEGMTAGVVGLLLAVVWDLARKAPRHWCCFVVGGMSFFMGFAFSINPIWLVLMGGVAGVLKLVVETRNQKQTGSQPDQQR